MKKFLYFIVIFAAMIAAFTLASCGKKDSDANEVANIPFVESFTCDSYDANGKKIDNKKTIFEPGDEIWVKTKFTLLPDAYANGKNKFTLKFIIQGDFNGKIISANSSDTSDKDLTATFTADDKNSKSCEIETRINVNYSAGSFKIVYAYDDEVYTEACEFPLENRKTFLYNYDEAADCYIVSRSSYNNEWLTKIDKMILPDSYDGKPITTIDKNLFSNCVKLTYVTIPNGVTSIGDGAINSERDFRKTQQKIPNKIENSLQMIA